MSKIFGERLLELRSEKKLSQAKLAGEIDVGKSVVGSWERGESEPTLPKLIAIANYFHVSIDFLAGLED